jgi:Txe/YoeB family toxin of Txe-Axe toxin-antitoxin module
MATAASPQYRPGRWRSRARGPGRLAKDPQAAIPGNRLEALKGDRLGQYSIRINERWRICFAWQEGNAHDVEIADYY